MKTILTPTLVVILCITFFTGISQNYTGVCALGNIKTEAELLGKDSLLLDCALVNNKKIKQYAGKLNHFKCLMLTGNPSAEQWEKLLENIKNLSSAKNIVFNSNNFTALPYGFEKLSNAAERLAICNNDKIDCYVLAEQLQDLSNLRELSLDVNSVLELPESIFLMNNISSLVLINRAKGNGSVAATRVVYDFSVKGNRSSILAVKYVSFGGSLDSKEYDELSSYFSALDKPSDNSTGAGNFNPNETLYIPEYNYIKPPVLGLDVERELNTINPAVENVLIFSSGTKILIPPGAFTDKDGNPVTGNVTFSYREFRDPVDFLVSGIPMKYDSGGVVNNFESAGMFELYASAGKESLKLAPGKQIKMDFASTSAESTFNFYKFNDTTGNWEYKGKPAAQADDSKIQLKALSDAYLSYRSYLQNRVPKKDPTGLNERFESLNYIYIASLDSNFRNKKFCYTEHGNHHAKRLTNLVRIVRVKKNKEGDIVFKVKFDSRAHPEMEAFNNVWFLLADNVSVGQFKKEFCNKKFYNDIRVYRSGNGIELKLKGVKQFKAINAELVTVDNKGKIRNVKEVKHRMQRYTALLKRKERDFKKGRMEAYYYEPPVYIANPFEQSMYAYKESEKHMSKEEKKMDYDAWICYFNRVMENELLAVSNANVTSDNLMRSLVLDNMGVYNCDQIQRLQNPVEIFASYNKNENKNKKLVPQSVYIIDKKVNAVLQYDGYRGYGPEKIAFSNDADAQNVLLAINKDGTMAIYRTEGFKQNTFTNKSKFTFRVEELGNKYGNVGELKKSIGL